ncbi:MAG: ADP-ribosylglycohydrolase family protein [Oscillospiraceae bacterium]|jgi:ADP-ribosylglycohydrolase|nr:ADP-ribosylglycohydrolase family protein [Oscillospiraceae bacterium]
MLKLTYDSRFIGAFTGFSVGDAFGYPCRDLPFDGICARFEKKGCLQLAVSSKTETALFSDATQMMLFTADGITWASVSQLPEGVNYASYVFYAYQYWLYTQTKTIAGNEYSWLFDKSANPYRSALIKTKGLYKKRFSSSVNVDALAAAGNLNYGKIGEPKNDNSDNGAVKRVMPAGLFFNFDTLLAFRAGADFAAITHGNPTGYLSAGCYSAIIAQLVNGARIDDAAEKAMSILRSYDGCDECLETLRMTLELLGDESVPPLEAVRTIGTGNRADRALGIALFSAALHEDDYKNAVRLAVNHDGDSDVCGAMCGGLLGAYHGVGFVPKKWVKKLSYLRLIEDTAIRLLEQTYFNKEEPPAEQPPPEEETNP